MAMKSYVLQKHQERDERRDMQMRGVSYSETAPGVAYRSAQAFTNVPAYQRHHMQAPDRESYVRQNPRNVSDDMAEIQEIEIPHNEEDPNNPKSRFRRRGGRSEMQMKDNMLSSGNKWKGLTRTATLAPKPVISKPIDSDKAYHEYTIDFFQKTMEKPRQEQPKGPKFKREQEFQLPFGAEEMIAQQYQRKIKKWPRMPGMRQRPDRLVDPNRMYPVDFNPAELMHPPKPGIKSTFANNPEIKDRSAPRFDGIQTEPKAPEFVGGKMGQERGQPFHAEIEHDAPYNPKFVPMGVRLRDDHEYAEHSGTADNVDFHASNPQSRQVRLKEDREYAEGSEELDVDYRTGTPGSRDRRLLEDRVYADGSKDTHQVEGGYAGQRMGTKIKDDRNWAEGPHDSHQVEGGYTGQRVGTRFKDDRNWADAPDDVEYQVPIRTSYQRPMTLKEWKLSNAEQGHIEHQYANHHQAVPLGLETKRRIEGSTTPQDTEGFHTDRRDPVTRPGMRYEERESRDVKNNPTESVSELRGKPDSRGIGYSERKYESPQKQLGTTVVALKTSTTLGTRIRDPEFADNAKSTVDGLENRNQPFKMGTRLREITYAEDRQQIDSELPDTFNPTVLGIKYKDREYQDSTGNKVQGQAEPYQDHNNPNNPRMRDSNPRMKDQQPKIGFDTIQDKNATRYTVLRDTTPRTVAGREKPEYFDPEGDFKQRTRTKIRGLNVKDRTRNVTDFQEKVDLVVVGLNPPTPKYVRLSRPTTPAIQPKRDLRQEVEIIQKYFDLPSRE